MTRALSFKLSAVPNDMVVFRVSREDIEHLVGLADELGIETLWGEATKNSAPFYERVLNLPKVTDRFFVRGETMEHCRKQYRRAR